MPFGREQGTNNTGTKKTSGHQRPPPGDRRPPHRSTIARTAMSGVALLIFNARTMIAVSRSTGRRKTSCCPTMCAAPHRPSPLLGCLVEMRLRNCGRGAAYKCGRADRASIAQQASIALCTTNEAHTTTRSRAWRKPRDRQLTCRSAHHDRWQRLQSQPLLHPKS